MDIVYKRGQIYALDGIRGVAILLVIFFHCFERINIFPFNFLSEIGWVGVDLFFVLSGFLITGILNDAKGSDHYLKNFFGKRILRIFPLYYFTLLGIFVILKIPGISNINPVLDPRHLDSYIYYLTFTQNVFFSFNGWGVTDLLNHFWSLAIEEQFYLIWQFVILYADRSSVLWICLALIPVSIITRNYQFDSDFSYIFTLARIDALVIGLMLAILIRYYNSLLNKIALPLLFLCLLALIFVSINSPHLGFRNPYYVRFGYTLFALLFACIITLLYDRTIVGKLTNYVLSIWVLRFFGKYSYGLYVYRWLLYKSIYSYFEMNYVFPKKYILLFLLFVLVVSMVSFHTVEKYFLSFRYKFENKSDRKEPKVAKTDGNKEIAT
jgi:peptidoglycan/LPS O-acetylase OafA/YrhL